MFFVIASLINLVMAVYVSFSLLGPLHISMTWKTCLAAIIILFTQRVWLNAVISVIQHGSMSHVGFSTTAGFIQITLFTFFICAFVADLISIAFVLKGYSVVYKVPVVIILATIISVYGFYEAMRVPNVKEVTVKSDLLPANWKPVQIAVLSDLHIVSNTPGEKKWLEEVVAKTNALHPDVIMITGDIIDDSVDVLKEQVKPLFDLKAKDGVYYVFGNHELYRGSDSWQHYFESQGASVLNDETQDVVLNDNPVLLAGIYRRPELLKKQVVEKPVILLSHYPAVATRVPADMVTLQLSGHTHGGQILPLAWLVANSNSGFVRGLYQVGKSHLYVSPGTGLWRGFPFRFMVPPEITLITLERGV